MWKEVQDEKNNQIVNHFYTELKHTNSNVKMLNQII